MKKEIRNAALIALGVLGSVALSYSQEAANLLQNTTFDKVKDRLVPKWDFTSRSIRSDPEMAEQVDWTAQDDAGVACLVILTKSRLRSNLWWQQELPAHGGAKYQFSVEAKGTLDGKGAMQIGVYFLDPAGKWLGLQRITPSPGFSGEWEKAAGTAVAPENAGTVGVRVGANFDGEVKVFFKDPVLTESN